MKTASEIFEAVREANLRDGGVRVELAADEVLPMAQALQSYRIHLVVLPQGGYFAEFARRSLSVP